MSTRFLRGALGTVLGLAFTVVPGYCDAVLTFNVNGGGAGTIQMDTSNTVLSSFSNIKLSTVNISGATNTADNGLWTLTSAVESWNVVASNEFAVTATFSSCLGCVGTPNLTGVTFTNFLTGFLTFSNGGAAPNYTLSSGAGSNITVGFGTATTLSGVSSTFLSDLGMGNFGFGTITSGGISAPSGNFTSGTHSYTASSENLTVNLTATPEPASALLLGGALLILSVAARKRIVRA